MFLWERLDSIVRLWLNRVNMGKRKWRDQIEGEDREKRDKLIVADYHERKSDGSWAYTVKELAVKHGLSIEGIYKILEKYHEKRD